MNTYNYSYKEGKISHNIPENKIVDPKSIQILYGTVSSGCYENETLPCITQYTYDELKNNGFIMENRSDEGSFEVMFIKHKNGKVLATKVVKDNRFMSKYALYPVFSLEVGTVRWKNLKNEVLELKVA